MRIVVLTSSPLGFASVALPYIIACDPDNVFVAEIIEVSPPSEWNVADFRRLVRKTLRIGIFGAINGRRMRCWFERSVATVLMAKPIDELAKIYGIKLTKSPSLNSDATRRALRESGADLCISLGNSYIEESVFTIPYYGAINIHHEILPDYRGAQSVIWQLYHGSRKSGFTIHEINKGLDTGRILYRESVPIDFRLTLEETVTQTYAKLLQRSAEALANLLREYPSVKMRAVSQGKGRWYTTPRLGEYVRMVRQHERLRDSRFAGIDC